MGTGDQKALLEIDTEDEVIEDGGWNLAAVLSSVRGQLSSIENRLKRIEADATIIHIEVQRQGKLISLIAGDVGVGGE